MNNLKQQMIRVLQVKVKLSMSLSNHHATKTYWGSVGIAPRILNLGVKATAKTESTLKVRR
jgi:hypothetical protein